MDGVARREVDRVVPAGALLTADWQIEIQGLLTGNGTAYIIPINPGFHGLATATIKASDFVLQGQDGIVANRDYQAERQISIPYIILQTTQAAAVNALTTLRTAWKPVASTTDVELHGRFPGWGHWSCTGRPRGISGDDWSLIHSGVIRVLASFVATTPTITTGIT